MEARRGGQEGGGGADVIMSSVSLPHMAEYAALSLCLLACFCRSAAALP
jgi:hypothetical protein